MGGQSHSNWLSKTVEQVSLNVVKENQKLRGSIRRRDSESDC